MKKKQPEEKKEKNVFDFSVEEDEKKELSGSEDEARESEQHKHHDVKAVNRSVNVKI